MMLTAQTIRFEDASLRPRFFRGRGRFRGLTLIELLAVVVILAMVAGVAVVNAGSMNASAELRAIARQWQELDARARLHARSDGPVQMHIDSDNRAIRLVSAATNEQLAFIDLPLGTTVRIQIAAAEPASHVTIDRTGRSGDYTASVERNGGKITWTIYGLTGWVKQLETTP